MPYSSDRTPRHIEGPPGRFVPPRSPAHRQVCSSRVRGVLLMRAHARPCPPLELRMVQARACVLTTLPVLAHTLEHPQPRGHVAPVCARAHSRAIWASMSSPESGEPSSSCRLSFRDPKTLLTHPMVLLYLQRARESVLDASENAEGAHSAPRGTKASSYAKTNVQIFTLKRRHGRTTWRLLFLAV